MSTAPATGDYISSNKSILKIEEFPLLGQIHGDGKIKLINEVKKNNVPI